MASYLRFCLSLLRQQPEPLYWQNMPMDIILNEILPKLPVKSLVRFNTVCKLFNTFISSPEFVGVHLSLSASSDNYHIVISDGRSMLYAYHLDSLTYTSRVTFTWPLATYLHTLSVLGSCNGLLLVSHFKEIPRCLVILNPATQSYIDVPHSSLLPTTKNVWLGLGFDQNSQDYKIVMVCEDEETHTRITIVYSVNLTLWKVVDLISPLDSMGQRYDGVLINKYLLHWLFLTDDNKCRIGCFDICSERWTDDVLLPDLYYTPRPGIFFIAFGALDGCLFSMFDNAAMDRTDVWVLKKYGDQESWTKLLTFGYFIDSSNLIPVACPGLDFREVLLKDRSGLKLKLMWYNWKNNNTDERAKIAVVLTDQPFMYNESLVSLPGAKLFGDEYQSAE